MGFSAGMIIGRWRVESVLTSTGAFASWRLRLHSRSETCTSGHGLKRRERVSAQTVHTTRRLNRTKISKILDTNAELEIDENLCWWHQCCRLFQNYIEKYEVTENRVDQIVKEILRDLQP